jgi:hypothetical protein
VTSLFAEMWVSAGSQARKESTNTLRWKSVIPCAILICFVVIAISSSKSLASDAVSEHDELDSGPSFFGYAKEAGSLRSVKKVQVSAEWGERRWRQRRSGATDVLLIVGEAHIFEQTDIAPVRVQGRFWSGSK